MTRTGTLTSGSAVVTAVTADTTGLLAGMEVVGTGVPAGATIASVDSSSQITLSANATVSGTGVTLDINSILATSRTAAVTTEAAIELLVPIATTISVAITSETALTFHKELQTRASVTANSTADILTPSNLLAANARATATGSVSVTINFALQAISQVGATVGKPPLTFLRELAAGASAIASKSASLSANLVFSAQAATSAKATAYLTFVGQGLEVADVVNDILLLWGIEDARMSVEYLRERAITDLNAAMQVIWARAKDRDYFSRRTLSVSITAGETSATLDQEVQNIIGPVRRAEDKGNLRPLTSRYQLDMFGHVFLGQVSSSIPNGKPQAFFIERLGQSRADNVQIVLHVVPAPEETTELLVDAAIECPRYEWRDYCSGTPLSIPHRYAESVLLPICRKRAMSSHYFIQKDRTALIEDEYKTAMQVLGIFDPQLKEVETSSKKEAA